MKTITCDKCGRTLKPREEYRTISANQFIEHTGNICLTVYTQYATYEICDECNDKFNHFILNALSDFIHNRVTQDNIPVEIKDE